MVKNKTAFTLLEILVVMAIIAVIMYMIVQSMANFRRSVELQQASDQIVAAVNETKNFASNNILPDDVNILPDGKEIYAYRLTPSGNNVIRDVCSKTIGNLSNEWKCNISNRKDKLISDFLQNVVIEGSGCSDTILITMTNDWQYKEQSHDITYSDAEFCEFTLAHKEDMRVFRTFVFHAEKNTFEVEYAK